MNSLKLATCLLLGLTAARAEPSTEANLAIKDDLKKAQMALTQHDMSALVEPLDDIRKHLSNADVETLEAVIAFHDQLREILIATTAGPATRTRPKFATSTPDQLTSLPQSLSGSPQERPAPAPATPTSNLSSKPAPDAELPQAAPAIPEPQSEPKVAPPLARPPAKQPASLALVAETSAHHTEISEPVMPLRPGPAPECRPPPNLRFSPDKFSLSSGCRPVRRAAHRRNRKPPLVRHGHILQLRPARSQLRPWALSATRWGAHSRPASPAIPPAGRKS